jgi:hypothetical protein
VKRVDDRSKVFLTALIGLAAPCFAGSIDPADLNCNPATDPPAAGGCTWYNFYAATDGTISGGSSFMNYYVPASDPPWTIATVGFDIFRVLDGGHQGDRFNVFDNGILLGPTSATSIDASHSCKNDPTGPGFDPAACWNDPLMSRGAYVLPPGSHSLTVTWIQMVPGGNSMLQWFELADPIVIPEPNSLLLLISGLIAVVLLRIRPRSH